MANDTDLDDAARAAWNLIDEKTQQKLRDCGVLPRHEQPVRPLVDDHLRDQLRLARSIALKQAADIAAEHARLAEEDEDAASLLASIRRLAVAIREMK